MYHTPQNPYYFSDITMSEYFDTYSEFKENQKVITVSDIYEVTRGYKR